MTRNELEKKWNAIERGEIPDDYQNPFLSHFGFWDKSLSPSEQKARERARGANGF